MVNAHSECTRVQTAQLEVLSFDLKIQVDSQTLINNKYNISNISNYIPTVTNIYPTITMTIFVIFKSEVVKGHSRVKKQELLLSPRARACWMFWHETAFMCKVCLTLDKIATCLHRIKTSPPLSDKHFCLLWVPQVPPTSLSSCCSDNCHWGISIVFKFTPLVQT